MAGSQLGIGNTVVSAIARYFRSGETSRYKKSRKKDNGG
jgi:hypothetical protein